jgi:hypothetical protein
MTAKVARSEGDLEGQRVSSIEVEEDRLVVAEWRTSDRDIVSYFQDKPKENRTVLFEKVVKVGVVASNLVGTIERIDYVQKEFGVLETRLRDQLDKMLVGLENKFEDIFGEKGEFADLLQNTFGDKGKIVKEIFDPSREGTPIFQLRIEIERKLDEMRRELSIDKATEKVEDRTPLGGFRFEDEIENVLNAMVRARKGDQLERVTTQTGKVGRSKKGDFVLHVAGNPDALIVIDTKGGGNSLPEVRRTLDEAMENRGAAYGVLVAKDVSDLPSSVGWFNEYDDNKLVCALGDSTSKSLRTEILSIALAWARIRVTIPKAKRVSFDTTQIDEALTKAQDAVGRLKDILAQCTQLEKASDRIRELCASIGRDVLNQLKVIDTTVNDTRPALDNRRS